MRIGLIFFIIFDLIGFGILLHKFDKENVEKGEEPKYCLKFINEEEKEIKYLCLGYSLYRKYNKSPKEAMGDSESLKFGIWFLGKKEIKYNN